MKIFITIAAALLAGAGLTAAYSPLLAHDGGLHRQMVELLHGKAGGAENLLGRHLDELVARAELTRGQRRQVAEILAGSDVVRRADALLAAHAVQAEAIHASPFDEAALRAASLVTASTQEELAVSLGRLLHELHSTMTADQLERIAGHHPHLFPAAEAHLRVAEESLQRWVDANR